jgi:uncharacterized protein (TIGR00255 family)
MTGYGTAKGRIEGDLFSAEIRTVNNKYYKSRIKLPDHLLFLEEDIDRFLQKKLHRGMVNCVLKHKDTSGSSLFEINSELLKTCLNKLNSVSSESNVKTKIDMAKLLDLPGIICPVEPDAEQAEKIKKKILKITSDAADNLIEMRKAEGKSLAKDLSSHCELMKKTIKKISKLSDKVPKEYFGKLKSRAQKLLKKTNTEIDEQTLAREMAIYAEKSDISEELSRLSSHIEQFHNACNNDGQVGKRLDFLTQEMLREANTIASKSGNPEITHFVVDMKCLIDRIKEQVQNVE